VDVNVDIDELVIDGSDDDASLQDRLMAQLNPAVAGAVARAVSEVISTRSAG
jgi:hypothetical protein